MLTFSVLSEAREILKLEALTKQSLEESRFSDFVFSAEKFRSLAIASASNSARSGVLVAYFKGIPVGFVYCTAGGLAIADGPPLTTVTLFYVSQRYRETLVRGKIALGLLSGLESWAKVRGSKEVLFHVNFGSVSERVHRFLRRRNFRTIGGCYVKTVE